MILKFYSLESVKFTVRLFLLGLFLNEIVSDEPYIVIYFPFLYIKSAKFCVFLNDEPLCDLSFYYYTYLHEGFYIIPSNPYLKDIKELLPKTLGVFPKD